MQRCPCNSGTPYQRCCQPFHLGLQSAPSAERLMRSRYCAYALKLPDYINKTWHPATRQESLTDTSFDGIEWLGLTIHEVLEQGPSNTTVRFTALFKQNNDATTMQMTETSLFELVDDQWLYIDGTFD